MSVVLPSLSPEVLTGQLTALGHGAQFGPDDLLVADPRTDAAVGACLNVFLADDAGVVNQSLGDQPGCFNQVGRMADDARDQDLAVGEPDVAPDLPLVGVPDVAGLDGVGLGVDLQQ